MVYWINCLLTICNDGRRTRAVRAIQLSATIGEELYVLQDDNPTGSVYILPPQSSELISWSAALHVVGQGACMALRPPPTAPDRPAQFEVLYFDEHGHPVELGFEVDMNTLLPFYPAVVN
jgi:hypothetical protein